MDNKVQFSVFFVDFFFTSSGKNFRLPQKPYFMSLRQYPLTYVQIRTYNVHHVILVISFYIRTKESLFTIAINILFGMNSLYTFNLIVNHFSDAQS